ncbi:hypothetical protein FBU30_010643 [Linnemannia zychae]|nr:hypothetical protein FBU30_010643 [Linnemannia zychae]
MKVINPSIIETVYKLLEQGKSTRQIAKEVGISKSTVQCYSKSYAPGRNKNKGGRPRKRNNEVALYIRFLYQRRMISSAAEGARRYNDENKDSMSANTIRRALMDIGMKIKKPVRKPKLTKAQMKACLDVAPAPVIKMSPSDEEIVIKLES